MRRMMVLSAAGVAAVAVGLVSYTFGLSRAVQEPAAIALPAKIPEPDIVTGTNPSPDPSPQPQLTSTSPIAFPPPVNTAATSNSICKIPMHLA